MGFKWVDMELWLCKNFKIVTNEVLKHICSKLLTNTNYIRRTCLHPCQTNICILNKFLKWVCCSLPVHNDDFIALHLFLHRFECTMVIEWNVCWNDYYVIMNQFRWLINWDLFILEYGYTDLFMMKVGT